MCNIYLCEVADIFATKGRRKHICYHFTNKGKVAYILPSQSTYVGSINGVWLMECSIDIEKLNT